MADPYSQYLEGVPDVSLTSGPSVFSSSGGMSPRQRHFLAADRLRGQSAILESRERITSLRDREASRVQGSQAMSILSGLDPVSDPDYDQKVMGVLSKNPAAALDKTVATFLDVQGGIFERAETERQRIDDEARQKIIDRERSDETLRREDLRIRQEVGLRRDLEAEDIIANLPTQLLSKFDEYRKKGLDQRGALKRTMEDAEGEAEVNELRASGLSEFDIKGVLDPSTGEVVKEGLLGPDGRVDPAKKASLLGTIARQEKEKKENEEQIKIKEVGFDRLTRYRNSLDPVDDAELIKDLDTRIARAGQELGLLTPNAGEAKVAGQTDGGSMKDTTKVIPKKDVLPSDRFIP